MSNARSDQLVTFTRSRREALPVDDGDLLSAALNQARTFELGSGVRDGRPLDAPNFDRGEARGARRWALN